MDELGALTGFTGCWCKVLICFVFWEVWGERACCGLVAYTRLALFKKWCTPGFSLALYSLYTLYPAISSCPTAQLLPLCPCSKCITSLAISLGYKTTFLSNCLLYTSTWMLHEHSNLTCVKLNWSSFQQPSFSRICALISFLIAPILLKLSLWIFCEVIPALYFLCFGERINISHIILKRFVNLVC